MFGLFKRASKPKPPAFTVWGSTEAKDRAIVESLLHAQASGQRALLVAHFDESIETLCDGLPEAGIDLSFIEHDLTPDAINRLGVGSRLVRSDRLSLPNDTGGSQRTEQLHLIAIEPHFFPEPDQHIKLFADVFGDRVMYHHYCSLEDPMMRLFVGPNTIRVLEATGMKPEDSLDSPMVQRAIVRAQQKFKQMSDSVTGDVNMNSYHDLFERHQECVDAYRAS